MDERKFLPGFLSPLENWLWVGAAQKHRHPQRKNWDQIEPTRKHCSSNLPKVDFFKGFKRSLTRAKVLRWNGKQRNGTCCECNQLSDSLQSNNKVTIKGRQFRSVHLYKLLPVRQSETAFLNAVNILCSWPSLTETLLFNQIRKLNRYHISSIERINYLSLSDLSPIRYFTR